MWILLSLPSQEWKLRMSSPWTTNCLALGHVCTTSHIGLPSCITNLRRSRGYQGCHYSTNNKHNFTKSFTVPWTGQIEDCTHLARCGTPEFAVRGLTICHQAVPVKVRRDCKTVSMPIIHCSSTRLCCRPISPRHGTRTLITTLGAPTYRSKMAGEIVTSAGYPMFGTLMVTNYIYIYIICKLIYIYIYVLCMIYNWLY